MHHHEIIQIVMFDYSSYTEREIIDMVKDLPDKDKRWLGANHPDNRTRKVFFRLTNIKIGDGSVINQNFIVSDNYLPLLTIGRRVAISPNVTIICASGPNNSRLQENVYVRDKLICEREVIIHDDVWVGAGTIILPGVTVGRGSIIGAGSVVNKDISEYSVFAGNPAKLIRLLND